MDPFGTGQALPPLQLPQTVAPAATSVPLKKPPKWIRRPVGATFAVSPVLPFSLSFLTNVVNNSIQPFFFFFNSFLLSLVGSWCPWKTQSRTPSSLSSPARTWSTSVRWWRRRSSWSAPSSCRPPWAPAASWTSARGRSTLPETSLKRPSGLFSRCQERFCFLNNP